MKIKFLLIMLLLSIGCSDHKTTSQTSALPQFLLDSAQAKQQALTIIDKRLAHGLLANGFVRSELARDWSVTKTSGRSRLSNQACAVYLFCEGYRLTGDTRYLEAANRSAEFMISNMFDSLTGRWNSTATENGVSGTLGTDVYSHSFVVFAMAHAFNITKQKDYLRVAYKTWMVGNVWPGLKAAKACTKGVTPDRGEGVWCQNPFMHLFEALLALYETTGDSGVWSDIEAIAMFVKDRLQQPSGSLPEYFYFADFNPQSEEDGGHIIVGHQVEWAYLLNKAVDLGLGEQYRDVAKRLYNFAVNSGWRESNGVLLSRADYSGNAKGIKYDWWSQAEMLRLSHYLASKSIDVEQNTRRFNQSLSFVNDNLVDPQFGGWNERSLEEEPNAGKVLGYHAVAMYVSVLNDNKIF